MPRRAPTVQVWGGAARSDIPAGEGPRSGQRLLLSHYSAAAVGVGTGASGHASAHAPAARSQAACSERWVSRHGCKQALAAARASLQAAEWRSASQAVFAASTRSVHPSRQVCAFARTVVKHARRSSRHVAMQVGSLGGVAPASGQIAIHSLRSVPHSSMAARKAALQVCRHSRACVRASAHSGDAGSAEQAA